MAVIDESAIDESAIDKSAIDKSAIDEQRGRCDALQITDVVLDTCTDTGEIHEVHHWMRAG